MTDWTKIREHKLSPEKPDGWPKDVRAISIEGLNLFGIDEKTGRLYWDGKEVMVRSGFYLLPLERWIAIAAATGALGTFLVNLVRLLMGK